MRLVEVSGLAVLCKFEDFRGLVSYGPGCWIPNRLKTEGFLLLADEVKVDSFVEFVAEVEAKLRYALSAAYGSDVGREAAAEALAYGWEHWSRLRVMHNPGGYLYRVGQGAARRLRRKPRLLGWVAGSETPWVEPELAPAMNKLSERQRVVVALLHAFDWTHTEVSEFLSISRASVQTHERRALNRLKKDLGVEL